MEPAPSQLQAPEPAHREAECQRLRGGVAADGARKAETQGEVVYLGPHVLYEVVVNLDYQGGRVPLGDEHMRVAGDDDLAEAPDVSGLGADVP